MEAAYPRIRQNETAIELIIYRRYLPMFCSIPTRVHSIDI